MPEWTFANSKRPVYTAASNSLHDKKNLILKQTVFEKWMVDKGDLSVVGSKLYTNLSGTLSFGSEADVQNKLGQALEECTDMCGLADKMTWLSEVSYFGDRPDLIAVVNQFMCGVVEIKLPESNGKVSAAIGSDENTEDDHTVLEASHVAGQIYDYLMMLVTYFGIRKRDAIGAISTYNETRIVWLSAGSDVRR